MEDQFVTYEIALRLKELGFDDNCICHYNSRKVLKGKIIGSFEGDYIDRDKYDESLPAPLWQQAFNWFRNKYNYVSYISFNDSKGYNIEVYDIKLKDI